MFLCFVKITNIKDNCKNDFKSSQKLQQQQQTEFFCKVECCDLKQTKKIEFKDFKN